MIAMSSWQLPLEQVPPKYVISDENVGSAPPPPPENKAQVWIQEGVFLYDAGDGVPRKLSTSRFRKTIPLESIGVCNHEPHDISIGYRRWIICKKCNIDL